MSTSTCILKYLLSRKSFRLHNCKNQVCPVSQKLLTCACYFYQEKKSVIGSFLRIRLNQVIPRALLNNSGSRITQMSLLCMRMVRDSLIYIYHLHCGPRHDISFSIMKKRLTFTFPTSCFKFITQP